MPSNKLNLRERLEDSNLDLSMSEIEDVPVKEIAQIKKATNLDLSNNLLKSLGKNFAPMLTHLIKLDLSKNHLTELPENFGELVNLKHLDLYSNQLTHLPLSLGQLKMLRWLDLKGNPLVPKLGEIAGPCLDTQQCQQCARKVVTFLQTMQIQVAEERQRRLLQKRKQQEIAEQQKKEQQQQQQSQNKKKKKAAKANANAQAKAENGINNLQGAGDIITNAKKAAVKQQSSTNTKNKPAKDLSPDCLWHDERVELTGEEVACINDLWNSWHDEGVELTGEEVACIDDLWNSRLSASSLLFRFLRSMLFGALLTVLALWAVYLIDEDKFRGIQTQAVQIWNATVAVLPVQVVEAGQKLKEMSKPTITFVWSKAEAAYVWFCTNPTIQEYTEAGIATVKILFAKIYEIVRTFNQQIPVYVETVKKKFF